MMPDRLSHGRVLTVRYAIFFGGLPYNPGQRSVVSVAYKWAQMVDDVMIQSADQPADQGGFGRVVSRGRENMVDPVIELVAVRGEVSAVDHVRGLEYERDAQADNQMGKQESQTNQQRRLPQHHHRQNQHVSDIKSFSRKESDVLPQGMLRAFQIIMRREEETLEISQEDIVERKQRVHQQGIDMLKPMQRRSGFVGGKA